MRNRGVQEPYKAILTTIVVESNYTVKPKDALDQFKKHCEETVNESDFPSDQKVKSFVSSIKSNHKST